MNTSTDKYEVRVLHEGDLEAIFEIRKSSRQLQEGSYFSSFHEVLQKKIFIKLLNDRRCLFYGFFNDSKKLTEYIILSSDLLLTVLKMVPFFIHFFIRNIPSLFKRNSIKKEKKYGKVFYLMAKVLILSLLGASSKKRAFIIENCRDSRDQTIFSPMILGKIVLRELFLLNIPSVQCFYYSANDVIEKYLHKVAEINEVTLKVIKILELGGQKLKLVSFPINSKYLKPTQNK